MQSNNDSNYGPQKVVILGSGLMGRGIGQSFAAAGHSVTLVDLNNEVLEEARRQIRESLQVFSDAGLLSDSVDAILGRISQEVDLKRAASNASFVVEAIFENLNAKKDAFRILDEDSPVDCILGSNTSSLPISSIATAASKHPERIIGTHFWNPPHLMAAVEVVKGEKTSEETAAKTLSILRSIGKKPALVRRDIPGQIGIRILYAMIREATSLVEEGIATPEGIDTIVKEAIGTRLEVLGPLELADLSGVDLVNNVAKSGLYESLDDSKQPQKIIRDMVARNEIGIKTGKGFYNWKDGSKSVSSTIKIRDEHLMEILKERKLEENN